MSKSNLIKLALESSSPYQLILTPSEWLAVQDNPRQRNTERHLVRASKYLINPSQTHPQVSAAKLLDGTLVKLDGHTRALFWAKNPEKAPSEIHVTIYKVSSLNESLELYTHFDNVKAVENTSDKVYGAFEQSGWHPSSRYLTQGAISHALQMAEAMIHDSSMSSIAREKEIYDLVPSWINELKLLDSINPEPKYFIGPITACCLLTLRRRGESALEFWTLYNNDQGTKLEQEIDGVEALHRLRQKTKGGTHAERIRLIGRALSCYEMYRKGNTYKGGSASGPRQTDPIAYMK